MNTLVENIVKRFCGRYLKNFSSENVSISVGGSVALSNVELKLDSFVDLQLPYQPSRAFIGSLRVDLPLTIGGNFDIHVADIFLLFTNKTMPDDPNSLAHAVKALQVIIGLFYTELMETSDFFLQMSTGKLAPSLPKISTQDFENGQRILDRLSIVVERLHVRSEEPFLSHVPTMNGKETMALGILVDKLEFRGPNSTELSMAPDSWTTSYRDGLVVNKISLCQGLSIYCCRETPMHTIPDNAFTIDIVKQSHFRRQEGSVLAPMNFSATLSLVYQRSVHVFGPVKLGLQLGDIQMQISDEHIAYFMRFIDNIVNYVRSLKSRGRRHINYCITSSSQRARLRWNMIRDTIKQDFYQYCGGLDSGKMRWRAWFEQWRLAARYVAIREILVYHVGYEPELSEQSDGLVYSFAECLIDDHAKVYRPSSEQNRADGDEDKDEESARKNRLMPYYRYRGRGMIQAKHMKSAELLIRNLTHQIGPFTEDNPRFHVNSLGLSSNVVRALYAVQLEIETILPLRVCARARIWAEDKVKKLIQSPNLGVTKSSEEAATPSVTLLLAVVDGIGFRASFGMSTVDAYCTVQASNLPSVGTLYTESKSSPIGQGSETALLSWGQVLHIPITDQSLPYYQAPKNDAFQSAENLPSLRVDVEGSGIFSFSYGGGFLPVASAFDLPEAQDVSIYDSSIREHVITIKPVASLNFSQTSESSDVSVRLMSMVVVGEIANGMSKFQTRIKDAIEERRSIVARQEQVASREKLAGASDQEDEAFILDPSILSLQDFQVQAVVPMISLTIEIVHANVSGKDPNAIVYSQSPLCKLIVNDLVVHGNASSNPWSGSVQSKLSCLQFQDSRYIAKPSGVSGVSHPMLHLNDLLATMNFSQISTMSQYVSGILDPTCFEWSGTISMFPTTIKVTSQSVTSATKKISKLWTNNRLLSHLWEPIAGWSLSGGSGRNPPESSSKLKSEAQLRFGDSYVLYPNHLHVAQEVFAFIDQTASTQKTIFSTSTGSRRLDAEIAVTSDGRIISNESVSLKGFSSTKTPAADAPVINTEVFTDFFGNMAQATSTFIGSNASAVAASTSAPAESKPIGDIGGFFDWMGKSIVTTNDSSQASSTKGGEAKAESWEVERARLQDRIRELETKNHQLESKLKGGK